MDVEALDIERITGYMSPSECDIILLGEVDSTNSYARRMMADNPKDGTVVIANSQTSGKGRKGRRFYSPPDTGLYFSYIMRGNCKKHDSSRITIAAAVATAEAIEDCCGIQVGIKWVNDLFVEGKKIAGILCEGVSFPQLPSNYIIGIGVNCYTVSFPQDIREKAGSICNTAFSRNKLAGLLCSRLNRWLERLDDHRLIDAYRDKSILLESLVEFERNGKLYRGRAVCINDDGSLTVELSDKNLMTIVSGDVSLLDW